MVVPMRRRVIRAFFIVILLAFLLTNLNLLIQSSDSNYEPEVMRQNEEYMNRPPLNLIPHVRYSEPNGLPPTHHNVSYNTTSLFTNKWDSFVNNVTNSSESPLFRFQSSSSAVTNASVRPLTFPEIEKHIQTINKEQQIWNLERFDLQASSDTVVVVVQVHNRAEYLRYLVDSLSRARNIANILLIFSHDYYDVEVENIVLSIKFCPVMQIYYPYPMQIHPHEFPGEDPNDCKRDMKRDQAMAKGCNNANYPDKYGHYREAKFTQTKHHWFWKINRVFDNLDVLRNHNGPVLFLEEDHYVTTDFVHTLLSMYRLQEQSCSECRIMTLGNYDKNPLFGTATNRVDVLDWSSSKHNMGMSLNRETWNMIRRCSKVFCTFDDYNWDWSLQHISMTCLPKRLKVMVMKSPRVFHIGECGVHHKGKNCHPVERVYQIEELLERNKDFLFPNKLFLNAAGKSVNRSPKPNGGWGDVRDHNLCLSFTKQDVTGAGHR